MSNYKVLALLFAPLSTLTSADLNSRNSLSVPAREHTILPPHILYDFDWYIYVWMNKVNIYLITEMFESVKHDHRKLDTHSMFVSISFIQLILVVVVALAATCAIMREFIQHSHINITDWSVSRGANEWMFQTFSLFGTNRLHGRCIVHVMQFIRIHSYLSLLNSLISAIFQQFEIESDPLRIAYFIWTQKIDRPNALRVLSLQFDMLLTSNMRTISIERDRSFNSFTFIHFKSFANDRHHHNCKSTHNYSIKRMQNCTLRIERNEINSIGINIKQTKRNAHCDIYMHCYCVPCAMRMTEWNVQ